MGILAVVFASILFGTFPSIQKNVLATGATPIGLVIVCNGLSCLFSLILCRIQRRSLRVSRRELLDLALIGIGGLFVTDYLLDVAYTMIPVGYVTMIHFLYPSIVCVIMATAFHEGMTRNKLFAILLSVAGLLLLTDGGFSGSLSGVLIAAVTALSYTFYMIMTDKTAAAKVDPIVRVFYTNLFVTLSAIVTSARIKAVFPSTPFMWLESVVIGLMLCSAIFLLNIGVQKIGSGTASFINMLEPVTSLVVSLIAYHYGITVMSLVGCGLILCSLVFAAKKDTAKSPAPMK